MKSLLVAIAGLLALQPLVADSSSSPTLAWPEPTVLVADRPDAERYDGLGFDVLHPQSLEVLAAAGNVKSKAGTILAPGGWAVAADGATLVAFESAWNVDAQRFERFLVVRDGLAGGMRGRFPLPEALGHPRLSTDGRRLVASVVDDAGEPSFGTYVIDTRDGRVLSSVPGLNLDEFWTEVDLFARRAVRVQLSEPLVRPVASVVVLEIETGAVLGRLELGDRAPSGAALALSPDGKRLALLDPDTEQLTLVGLDPLAIERSFALSGGPSAFQVVLEALGVLPRVAHAKPEHGQAYQLAFAADGEHLYIYGSDAEAVGPDTWATRGLGLRKVDLRTESVVATGVGERYVARVFPTADGSALYAWALADPSPLGGLQVPNQQRWELLRLDPRTLEVLATRPFTGSRQVLVWPDVPGS